MIDSPECFSPKEKAGIEKTTSFIKHISSS